MHFVLMLPFVGDAIRRAADQMVETDYGVQVPVLNVIDCAVRILAILAVLVIAVRFLLPGKSVEKITVTDGELVEAFPLEEEEFKETLSGGRADQIFRVLDKVQENPEDSYESKAALLRNKIFAASKVGRTRLPSLQINGLKAELGLRVEMVLRNLEAKRFDSDDQQGLVTVSGLYESVPLHGDDERSQSLMQQAKLAAIVAEVVNWVEKRNSITEEKVIVELKRKMAAMRVSLAEGGQDEVLERLARIARGRLAEQKRSQQVCDELDAMVVDGIHRSEDRVRREFADLNCMRSASDWILNEGEGTSDADFFDKFYEKLRQMMMIKDLNARDRSQIFEKLNQLAESGWSREISKPLTSFVDLLEDTGVPKSDPISQSASALLVRLDWRGEQFELEGFRTSDGLKPSGRAGVVVASLLFFVDKDTRRESNAHFQQLLRFAGEAFKSAKIRVVIVFVNDGSESDEVPVMDEFAVNAKQMGVQVWRIDTESERWTESLGEGLPISELPYLLVLDSQNRVFSLNPNRIEVGKIIPRLKF